MPEIPRRSTRRYINSPFQDRYCLALMIIVLVTVIFPCSAWGRYPSQWKIPSQDEKPSSLFTSPAFSAEPDDRQYTQRLPRRQAPEAAPKEEEPAFEKPSGDEEVEDFTPIEDRWRIGYQGGWLDPYNQNVLKGDYPIFGQNVFFAFTGTSDTLIEFRMLPTPSGISALESGSAKFFGDHQQLFATQNIVLRFELFEGDTAFRPLDWLLAVEPVFNINHMDVKERGIVNPDVRDGTERTRRHIGFQELLLELHLGNVSRRYDFVSAKVGIQPFNSDFRSLIFSDNNLGFRLLGTLANNRYQYNLIYLEMLEKDTNSGLNSFEWRDQQVLIGNLYWQDFIRLGYTTQFSIHYLRDEATFLFDDNDFLVRPDLVGDSAPHEIRAAYIGWSGDGHLGRLNINHAFYQVFGRDDHNPIAGRRVDINAQMAALELSVDRDWLRPKISLFWTSGDHDPEDGRATGFDTIMDRPNFAGGGFSFWNRQEIKLLRVSLVNRESLIPDLRSSKTQGQPNFVNPGILLLNAGMEVEVTPKLRMTVNINYLRFQEVKPLEVYLQQPDIGNEIGFDASIGFLYRPLLNNNIIVTLAGAGFLPGDGFEDILTDDTLFQVFTNLIFTY